MDGCLADAGKARNLRFGESGACQEDKIMVSIARLELPEGVQSVAPEQLDCYAVQLVVGKVLNKGAFREGLGKRSTR